jgi:hypothetical protein
MKHGAGIFSTRSAKSGLERRSVHGFYSPHTLVSLSFNAMMLS